MNDDLESAIERLSASSSRVRRAAARKLRRLGNAKACPSLSAALEKEMADKRTWETQYHLAMAVAASGCELALGLLWKLAEGPVPHMVAVAFGDAITRLSLGKQSVTKIIDSFPQQNHAALTEGFFRALASTHHVPAHEEQRTLLAVASQSDDDSIQIWAAAAAAGWEKDIVGPFLRLLELSARDDTRRAAKASLAGVYLDWNPL